MRVTIRNVLLATAGMGVLATPAVAQNMIDDYEPVTAEMLSNPANGEWPIYRGNYQGWGYSELSQITADNVGDLQLVWSRGLEPGANETTPLMHDGVIFIGQTNDVIQAIDAATGSLIWEHRRSLPADEDFVNVVGQNKRSVALWDDKLYFISADNYVVALDAASGQVVFESDRGVGLEVTNTNGPIVVEGVVVAGSSCQFSAFGCYATGHDAENGEELWRHNFIPRPGEEGDETWGDSPFESRWMTGSWGAYTYSPDTGLVYYGSTGVGPAAEVQRGMEGATLDGTNTRFAVDPATGEIVWSHQVLPRDNWDQECTYEAIIVESPINPNPDAVGMLAVGDVSGETRLVQTGVPCKTGLAWTFDAATGEFLWAKETVQQTLVESVADDGLVTINEDMIPGIGPDASIQMCPTFLGGKDWPPAAYDPNMNAFFVPLNNLCYSEYYANEDEPTPLDVYNVSSTYMISPGEENIGRIDAISVETGDTLWTWETRDGLYSPVLATAGGVLFTGGFDRYFRAIDSESGELVWETRLASTVDGHATTFEVDGRQYVAVTAGGALVGGAFGDTYSPNSDPVIGNNALYVFALPEN